MPKGQFSETLSHFDQFSHHVAMFHSRDAVGPRIDLLVARQRRVECGLDTWLGSSGALSALAIHSNARMLSSLEAWFGPATASLSSPMARTLWKKDEFR